MNPAPTKSTIKDSADALQKYARRLNKLASAIAAAEQDAQKFQAEIDGIDSPDYNDDAQIQRLTTARTKLDLCQQAIERLNEKAEGEIASYSENLSIPSHLAAKILSEIVDRRRETITASLLPFCRSKSLAVQLAQQTDAYASAMGAIYNFTGMTQRLGSGRTAASVAKAANEILAVLSEALKDAPDLIQFMPFQPESETAAETA